MKEWMLCLKCGKAVPFRFTTIPDINVCKEVITACYQGGMHIFEFTNRGDLAHELFAELVKWSRRLMPDLVLGVGTVVDAGTCSLYIQLGARFIVSPLLNEDMAKVCNRRKVLWIPGCATASEIGRAEELGAEVVKLSRAHRGRRQIPESLPGPLSLVQHHAFRGSSPHHRKPARMV
jgi:2-dehydro-3-deoxyphosphogluconate aldolase/(4S)-4-hydroxy-2-oxoglutarate aldolase